MAKNHKKYRKDKPWDTEDIDHWKLEEWDPENLKGSLLEESSFATLFPKYREKYLRDVWPVITKCLEVMRSFCALHSSLLKTKTVLHIHFCLILNRNLESLAS
jgi:ribosomal RNA assembly protein